MRVITILIIISVSLTSIYSQDKNKAADTTVYRLEQVVVSATRYPEKVLEIPYAVTLLTKKQLEDLKGYGLDEILSSVPGVLAQSRSGNQDIRIVVRGFGARGAGNRSNSGTSRGIRVMIDGIPETEPDGRTSFDQVDASLAENLEVVRSNSSALWGNASGGIINISSVPNFDKDYINVKGLAGSYGFSKYIIQAASLLKNGKLFGSFSSSSFRGWRDHSRSTRSILNIGIVSKLSNATKLGVYMIGSSNLFHIPGPLTKEQFDTNPAQANQIYVQRDERRYNRLGRIGVALEHNIDEHNEISGMVYVNPKYLQRSERGTFRDFTRYHVGGNFIYRNFTHLNSDISNNFTAGIDEAYQDGAILFYSLSPTNYRGDVLKADKREGANNFGAFFQNEIMFEDKLSLILGGRYDDVTYYSEDFLEQRFGQQKKSFVKFTPKAGITYRLSPVQSIYANLGGGVEVPAGNETDPAGTYGQDTVYLINPLLDPIISTTFEIGTKHVLYFGSDRFFQSITYDLALYHVDVKNDIIPYRGGRFYFTAGKTTRTGAELGANIQLGYGLSIQTALTYSVNKYINYTVDSVHYGRPNKYADYKNNKVAGIPDFFYNVGFGFAPTHLNGFFVNLSFNGIGKYFVDDANTIEVPAFNIINTTIGFKNGLKIYDNIALKGFVSINNILDRKYAGSAFINPDIIDGKHVYLEPGMPRNITASISIEW